ncbi:unnamed protein product [Colias eurytheme]|nr:unnamed protein product [Colias eurytheme]
MIRSRTLERKGKIEMGRKSEKQLGLDFLGRGITCASFQVFGNLPEGRTIEYTEKDFRQGKLDFYEEMFGAVDGWRLRGTADNTIGDVRAEINSHKEVFDTSGVSFALYFYFKLKDLEILLFLTLVS